MDSEAGIKATLVNFNCLHLFDYAVGYDSGFGSKPGPGMVLGFCQQTGLKPEQVMVVGDNTHDLHMGQSAAAGFNVGVLTGTSTKLELEADADLVLDSIADLVALWS
jgi:phosphoglycolate phosphatase